MKAEYQIDADNFDVFIKNRVYLNYAREILDPEQFDEIDEARNPRCYN